MISALCCLSQTQRATLTLPIGHQLGVNTIDFSKDGKLIVTGGLDNTFILWDARTGFIVRRTVVQGPVQQVLFTPDGLHIIIMTGQTEAKMTSKQKPILQKWDVKTGRMLVKLPFTASPGLQFLPQSGYLLVPDYSDDVTAKKESYANQYDVNNPEKTLATLNKKYDKRYNDSMDRVAAMKSQEVKKAMGSPDLTDSKQLEEWHKRMVQGMMGDNPEAKIFERNITVVDIKTNKAVADLQKTPEQIRLISYGNKEYIVTPHESYMEKNSKRIVAWDIAEFINQYKEKRTINSFKEFSIKKRIHLLAASYTNGFLATDAGTDMIQLWQMDKPNSIASFKTKGSQLNNIELSAKGDTLYAYSTTGTINFMEAWSTATYAPIGYFTVPWHYQLSNIRLSPSGEYFVAYQPNGLLKLSTAGDSLTQFHGNWSSPSYFGFTKNDHEAYVAYGVSPQLNAYIKQSGITTKQGNDYIKQAFEKMIEDEAKAQNKTLTAAEKERLLNEKMQVAYAAVNTEIYKGYVLLWDLLRGGARYQKTDAYPAPHKNISTNKNYELANEKYESANKETGKMVASQLNNVKKSDQFHKDSLQKAIKDLENSGAFVPDQLKKDPTGSTASYLNGLQSIVSQESFNGPVTLLINKKTKDSIALININSTDWVMLLKNGYYMSSKNGAKSLSYSRGIDVFPFEQFDIQYNRPDKVLAAIGLADTALIEAYKRAHIKRMINLDIDTTQFRNDFTMPEADFSNRNRIALDQKTNKLTLNITASDEKNMLNRFNVWVNEVPLFGKNGKSIKDAKSKKLNTNVEITLSQGMNRIETSVINNNGIESYRTPLAVKYSSSQPKLVKTYFIGIGINRFADPSYNLQYCAKDIRDLTLNLKKKYGAELLVDTLFNEKVTVANIKAIKAKLLQAGEDDKVIIAYAGHGLFSNNRDYYLSTYDMNFENPAQKGLSYDELENLVDGIKSRKKLMLIDACHSGEIDRDEKENNSGPGQAESGTRGIKLPKSKSSTLGLKNSFELMQELFVNVSRGTGTTIIAAAAGTQFAQEREDLKNGVFSFTVLELMEKNKTATVKELKEFVSRRVLELTNGQQQPTTRNETQAIDWTVW